MEEVYFRRVITVVILATLVVLSFFLLKPILLSVIMGFILAFVFTPIYNRLYKLIKFKNLTALIICFLLVLLIFLPLWFLIPVFIDQSIKLYLSVQNLDFITPLQNIFPSLFSSEKFSAEIGSILNSFVTKSASSLMNSFSKVLLNFPNLLLQFLVVFFTFFFVLKDKEELIKYIQSLLPFSKEVEKKLFKSSRDITSSVIYGQIIVGVIQGLIAGLGFFIFKVPNALIFTLFASFAGIIPIIGPGIVWIPITIYLFITGNTFAAFGVLIFGSASSIIDNVIKPIFVSKRTTLHPALIVIGMVGGFFLFGVLGFILGPLILAYLLIVLEVYRSKKSPKIFEPAITKN
jgi:predicted PurR-regulated permease PerM